MHHPKQVEVIHSRHYCPRGNVLKFMIQYVFHAASELDGVGAVGVETRRVLVLAAIYD